MLVHTNQTATSLSVLNVQKDSIAILEPSHHSHAELDIDAHKELQELLLCLEFHVTWEHTSQTHMLITVNCVILAMLVKQLVNKQ